LTSAREIVVVQHWFEELKSLVPTRQTEKSRDLESAAIRRERKRNEGGEPLNSRGRGAAVSVGEA
jgi:hypothetical protein